METKGLVLPNHGDKGMGEDHRCMVDNAKLKLGVTEGEERGRGRDCSGIGLLGLGLVVAPRCQACAIDPIIGVGSKRGRGTE